MAKKNRSRFVSGDKYSHPYIIRIKNLTDEKIWNVKLFDDDFENQSKLEYQYLISTVSYKKFLKLMSAKDTPDELIGQVLMVAKCDYEKFRDRQLNVAWTVSHSDMVGSVAYHIHQFKIGSKQKQMDRVMDDTVCFSFFNALQISLEYLMPETEIIFRLYPLKTKKKK